MNAEPHTHDLLMESYDLEYSWGQWQVTYGDTHIKLADRQDDPYEWSTEELKKQVAKKAKEAIQQHDRGTVTALQKQRDRDHKVNAVREVLGSVHSMLTDRNRWGGEQLK